MLAYSYIQKICKKSMKSSPHVFFSFTFFFFLLVSFFLSRRFYLATQHRKQG